MSDYDKALESAGYVFAGKFDAWGKYKRTPNRLGETDTIMIEPNVRCFFAETAGPLSDLSALLNPLTPELVDHAASELAASFREKGFLKAEAAEALPAMLALILARLKEDA